MKIVLSAIAITVLVSGAPMGHCATPSNSATVPAQIDPDARQQIDAGNQLWVDAMKQGNVALLVPGNTADAVDCSAEGNCVQGRTSLGEHMKQEMAKSGKADSASVVSIGSVQMGRYVYEWGEAKAHFPTGESIDDRYLTVWQRQPDGTWKVFRNLVIPNR